MDTIDELLDELLDRAGINGQRKLIHRILTAGVGLGRDRTERLNLKITAAAIEEMRMAFQLFAPYAGVSKVTVFGSARTLPGDPLSTAAEDTARALADDGWMVVTGAGPGIMEAASTGAGPEQSLGVSIRLPFEEATSEPNLEARRVMMRYFFTRKLMLVKESQAFVCLPGGFGTLDETFELFTLQQTGKMEPTPIVLLDRPGGAYWEGFRRFIVDQLEGGGFVTPGDLDRVLITESVEEAVAEIRRFWRNYRSMRWVGDVLVLRVRVLPTPEQLDELTGRFASLLDRGRIEITGPLPEEGDDEADMPRLKLVPRKRGVGELHRLIRALNELPQVTAEQTPDEVVPPPVSTA